jgi:ABC-type multidrug transport system fused ATPase/permease subunit
MHQDMIRKVLNAPINLYFDVTPIGRILNKFSKDLSVIETNLSYIIGSLLGLFYQSIAILVVASLAVYWILLILPVLIYLTVKLYQQSISSYRETNRIESITKSPLISYLAETHSGASTIRAFGK